MKSKRAVLMAVAIMASGMTGTAAWADRGYHHRGPFLSHRHHGHGLGLGAGLVLGSALLWAATRPPAPVYVAPEPEPVVVMPPRPIAAPVVASGDWWYYCRPAGAYYPYVQSCPTGWERVLPRPGAW